MDARCYEFYVAVDEDVNLSLERVSISPVSVISRCVFDVTQSATRSFLAFCWSRTGTAVDVPANLADGALLAPVMRMAPTTATAPP